MNEPLVNLRPVENKDLELMLNWRNSERVRRNMFSDHLIAREEHLQWFEKLTENKNTNCFIFDYNEQAAGVVNIGSQDYSGKSYWGFYLGNESLPQGTGTLMGKLAIDKAFTTLGIRKLCAEVLGYNEISIHFHKKLGFSLEGIFVQHVLKEGRYVDVLNFAKFNPNRIE